MLRRLTGADVPNTVYPTDNEWGVPVLRLDRQADVVDVPFSRWGRATRKSRMKGTWHFYTDDYKFSTCWSRPQVVVNSACVAAVECNFSVHAQTPAAIAVYQTFRKRWLARLWQDRGIRVLVDLNVAREHRALNLLGVPRGWRAFATRGAVARLTDIEEEHAIAAERAGGEPLFVVYGGGADVAELARRRAWHWFPEEADAVRAEPRAAREPLRLVP